MGCTASEVSKAAPPQQEVGEESYELVEEELYEESIEEPSHDYHLLLSAKPEQSFRRWVPPGSAAAAEAGPEVQNGQKFSGAGQGAAAFAPFRFYPEAPIREEIQEEIQEEEAFEEEDWQARTTNTVVKRALDDLLQDEPAIEEEAEEAAREESEDQIKPYQEGVDELLARAQLLLDRQQREELENERRAMLGQDGSPGQKAAFYKRDFWGNSGYSAASSGVKRGGDWPFGHDY